jgi:hypothetical protein
LITAAEIVGHPPEALVRTRLVERELTILQGFGVQHIGLALKRQRIQQLSHTAALLPLCTQSLEGVAGIAKLISCKQSATAVIDGHAPGAQGKRSIICQIQATAHTEIDGLKNIDVVRAQWRQGFETPGSAILYFDVKEPLVSLVVGSEFDA